MWRGPFSTFRELLEAGKKKNLTGANIRMGLQRMAEDQHLQRLCQRLKKEGKVRRYEFDDAVSAKLLVWLPGKNNPKSISNERELYNLVSSK